MAIEVVFYDGQEWFFSIKSEKCLDEAFDTAIRWNVQKLTLIDCIDGNFIERWYAYV